MRILAVTTIIFTLILSACGKPEAESAQLAPAVEAVAAQVQETVAAPVVAVVEKADAKAEEAAATVVDAHAGHQHAAEQAKEAVKPVAKKALVEMSAQAQYFAGTHYEELATPVKTITGNKIEVTEVFSYACIHCFHFESAAKAWLTSMPEGVEFVQSPAIFNKAWAHYARIFYTAKSLNVLDQVHLKVFEAMHVGRNRLNDPDDIAAIFAEAGVDAATFKATFDSFGVSSQMQATDKRVRDGFKTQGTPELIVDGRYRVTTGMAGGHAAMFKVVDFLIGKIKIEKGLN
mgnify:CR=1 FL=1